MKSYLDLSPCTQNKPFGITTKAEKGSKTLAYLYQNRLTNRFLGYQLFGLTLKINKIQNRIELGLFISKPILDKLLLKIRKS